MFQVLVAELQVTIPGSVRRTLEQRGEFRGELGKLYLCRGFVVEVAEACSEGGSEGGLVGEEAQCNLYFELNGGQRRVDLPVDAQLGQEPVALDDGFAVIVEWQEELQNLLVDGGRSGHYRRRGGRRTDRGRRRWLWLSAGRTSRGASARAASRRRWR
ncbi:hypothetical protein IEO21_11145 [Rhodonia placenta]|uniref:Uncharacterized protein n=1 Tax=Rhodonia placenta TaxID=104341 RepID=A0A8H7NR14_9APHY|nr:hypothetical protein IEO21_11145 [Postia placenta]